jgi:hypothetical protein
MPGSIDRQTALDRLMLRASARWPQEIGALALLDGAYLQLRGHAELVTDDALEHLDKLTRSYTCHPAYHGHSYPATQRWRETRVICRIQARRITLDAIHARAGPKMGGEPERDGT